jgi:ABC-2 type transport system permease protein
MSIRNIFIKNVGIFLEDVRMHIISFLSQFFFLYLFHHWFEGESVTNPLIFMLMGLVVVTIFEFSLRVSNSAVCSMYGETHEKKLALFIGNLLSVTAIAVFMGLTLYVAGFIIGTMSVTFGTVVLTLLLMILIGVIFASVGIFFASVIKSIKNLQMKTTIACLVLPPLAGAWVYLFIMPSWVGTIARFNPLTYAVALFRAVSLNMWSYPAEAQLWKDLAFDWSGTIITPATSLVILLIFGVASVVLAAIAFTKADFSKRTSSW